MPTDQITLNSLPPLGLYVHLPWCVRKCGYCDFNSHQAPASASQLDQLQTDYLTALITELEISSKLVWGRKVNSIYFGGGTPNLFSPEHFDRLISQIRALYPLIADCEISMEANPGANENQDWSAYRQTGINRISLGVQSFDNKQLKVLGRIHSAEQSLLAIEKINRAFTNFNLDLIMGLPAQDQEQLLDQINLLCAQGAPHLSVYQLTIEPNTEFAKKPPPQLLSLDTQDLLCEAAQNQLQLAKYLRYEVSAYATDKNSACQHNLNYWQFGDYLGIGAGACGKISYQNQIVRTQNCQRPQSYIERVHQQTQQTTTPIEYDEIIFEYLLGALRLAAGFSINQFVTRTSLGAHLLLEQLEEAVANQLLIIDNDKVIPSSRGFEMQNHILRSLLEAKQTKQKSPINAKSDKKTTKKYIKLAAN